MKRYLAIPIVALVAFGLLVAATPPAAPQPRTPEARAERMTQRLRYDLALTDAQYAKALEVNLNFVRALAAQRPTPGAPRDPEAKQQALQALRSQHKAALEALLTPEQLQTKAAIEQAHFEARLARQAAQQLHAKSEAALELERLTRALLLSAEQQTAVSAAIAKRQSAEAALLAATRSQTQPDPEAYRTAHQALRKAYRTDLKATLNPAQLEKLNRMGAMLHQRRQEHGPRRGPLGPGPEHPRGGPEGDHGPQPPDDNE